MEKGREGERYANCRDCHYELQCSYNSSQRRGTTADGRWRQLLLPRIGRCFGLGEVGGKCGATGGAVEVDGGR